MDDSLIWILKVGLGATFIATSLFIRLDPALWEGMVRPWASRLVGEHRRTSLMLTAAFDLAVGVWLLTPWLTWLAALLAAAHLVQVLATVRINHATYRDIALLAAALVLTIATWPS